MSEFKIFRMTVQIGMKILKRLSPTQTFPEMLKRRFKPQDQIQDTAYQRRLHNESTIISTVSKLARKKVSLPYPPKDNGNT